MIGIRVHKLPTWLSSLKLKQYFLLHLLNYSRSRFCAEPGCLLLKYLSFFSVRWISRRLETDVTTSLLQISDALLLVSVMCAKCQPTIASWKKFPPSSSAQQRLSKDPAGGSAKQAGNIVTPPPGLGQLQLMEIASQIKLRASI